MGLCVIGAWAPGAAAVQITVDEIGDSPAADSDGLCSLREAVKAANTNLAADGCPAGGAAPLVDTITLAAGTYQLLGAPGDDNDVSGDLDVFGSTVSGQGGKLIIDGVG